MEKIKSKLILIVIYSIAPILLLLGWAYDKYQRDNPTVYNIQLAELQDGVYAYREAVVSRVPAENCTMATICDKNGNIYTVKGNVRVINTDTETPYAVWEYVNIVNADRITIYAPAMTVVDRGVVSVR